MADMRDPRTALLLASAFACPAAACNADLAPAGPAAPALADLALADDGGTRVEAHPPDLALGPAGPPYPLVLVHGMAGFRHLGPLEYFAGIPQALRADGHDVWVSRQDPINDSDVRGAQLADFVRTVLVSTGKARVNLIGHSQGGFDVRFVASTMGERVASATTIATPHAGDPIADAIIDATGPAAQAALAALLDLYGAAAGYDSSARRQVALLGTAGALDFARRHPDDRRVFYFSLAGRSERSPEVQACWTPDAPSFVTRWSGALDPLDPLLLPLAAVLDGQKPRPVHDGLVPVASARYGRFLGCLPADHLDEVNLPPGVGPGLGNPFDAVQLYRDLAAWLVASGF